MLLPLVQKYVSLSSRIQFLSLTLSLASVNLFSALPKFYKINDLIWQDGLLIDFVQKKVTDKWIRKFLIVSSYLFSERALFTFVVKFFNDSIIWASTRKTIFEFSNVSFLFQMLLVVFLTFLVWTNLNALFILLF